MSGEDAAMTAGGTFMTGERLTTAAPLLLAGMLAALTFWLDRIVQPTGARPAAASRHDPDYIVERLSAVRMDESGAASYTLSAAKMVHYPDDDTTLLDARRSSSATARRQAPVTITASEAVVSGNGENVYFQDDVRVTRAAVCGRRASS